MRRWVRTGLVVFGLLLLATSGLVWWSAEQALGPAPDVRSSPRGGLSSCPVQRPGQVTCDPPVLASGAVAVVIVLAVLGLGAVLTVVVVGVLRLRRRLPD